MAKQSSIFLRNLSVVDCAIVMNDGTIQGASFHPNFTVTGPVDVQEQVVIDFSKCKNEIKAALDDFVTGYDHKCWFVEGFSVGSLGMDLSNLEDIVSILDTPSVRAEVPSHVFRTIENPDNLPQDEIIKIIENSVKRYVEQWLNNIWDGITVEVEMGTNAFVDNHNVGGIFTYWHGLPNSSSTKCRRGLHGHGSFYEFEVPDDFETESAQDLHNIMQQYLKVMFLDTRNIKEENEDTVLIEYTDIGGDHYKIEVSKHMINIVRMDVDTTIENIVEYIVNEHQEDFKKHGVIRFYASEGLAKGALKEI